MPDFVIDPEFRDLLPKLTIDQFAGLKDDIRKNGCRDKLVIWKEWNILIDGHNRHQICTELNLQFDTTELSFHGRDEVKMWMFRNQLGRRNLTDFQRGEIALLMKPVVEEIAKSQQARKSTVNFVRQISDEQNCKEPLSITAVKKPVAPMRTDEAVAKEAGVSRDTIRKVEAIKANASPEIIEQVRTGAKGDDGKKMTINKAYETIKIRDSPPAAKVPIEPLTEKQSQGWFAVSNELFGQIKDYCRKCPAARMMVVSDLRKLAKSIEGKSK